MEESDVYKLYDYGLHMNTQVVPEIRHFSSQYREIVSSASMAENYLANAGFDFDTLSLKGFTRNGIQTPLSKDATNKQRIDSGCKVNIEVQFFHVAKEINTRKE